MNIVFLVFLYFAVCSSLSLEEEVKKYELKLESALQKLLESEGRKIDGREFDTTESDLRALKMMTRVLSGKGKGDRFVIKSFGKANQEVNKAVTKTREVHTKLRGKKKRPGDLLRSLRKPSDNVVSLFTAQEIIERTLDDVVEMARQDGTLPSSEEVDPRSLISTSKKDELLELSGCPHRNIICDNTIGDRYRTMDGTCNNRENPLWGSAPIPLKRLLKSDYENGFNTPQGWNSSKLYGGYRKPSARLVSSELAKALSITEDDQYTHMLMQWGQFLDHDLDFTPAAVSSTSFEGQEECTHSCSRQSPCFPIPVPEDDLRIDTNIARCLGFTRSGGICNSGFSDELEPRQQGNDITSYIDASNVYGSSEKELNKLRDDLDPAFLRTGYNDFLPPDLEDDFDCLLDPTLSKSPCFIAGDRRVNEQIGLTSLHTLWMREHNRIAAILAILNPHWTEDVTFHESRKIVIAKMQHITFTEWLPKIIGKKGMETIRPYSGYRRTVDASISNEFATAAFRFGHTLVNPKVYRLTNSFQPIPEGNLDLHQAFFAPYRITDEGGIDPILRGLIGESAKMPMPDQCLNSELTEKLFALANQIALDLGALNIQRSRDHGLPSYNAYRTWCNSRVRPAKTMDDLAGEITNSAVRDKLKRLYGHPDNIDLWVGGIAETPVYGGRVGPTFRCIIADQFQRLRDGDRFWYEAPYEFEPDQLTEIRRSTLARVICDNSDNINQVQPDVFRMASFPQGFSDCDDIPEVSLDAWDFGQEGSGEGKSNTGKSSKPKAKENPRSGGKNKGKRPRGGKGKDPKP